MKLEELAFPLTAEAFIAFQEEGTGGKLGANAREALAFPSRKGAPGIKRDCGKASNGWIAAFPPMKMIPCCGGSTRVPAGGWSTPGSGEAGNGRECAYEDHPCLHS